jgi:hypothetical protein
MLTSMQGHKLEIRRFLDRDARFLDSYVGSTAQQTIVLTSGSPTTVLKLCASAQSPMSASIASVLGLLQDEDLRFLLERRGRHSVGTTEELQHRLEKALIAEFLYEWGRSEDRRSHARNGFERLQR